MDGPRLVDERFELLEVLGRGGHGVVYRALDRQLGIEVALKFLNDNVASDQEYNIRMVREAQAMAALAGTSAIRVYELRTTADQALYIVMELLHGQDLEEHFVESESRGIAVEPAYVLSLLDPIVETLEAAHVRGIVHRDLKPGNIFVLEGGGVRLLDFGLAKVLRASPLTHDGMIAGSPSYIAPEVWKGNPRVLDHRIDVYSLGAIVFRALSGRVPFEAETLLDKFQLVTRGPRPSLRALRPDLPSDVDAWVAQALAINPDERFFRVRAMWSALRDLFRGSTIRR